MAARVLRDALADLPRLGDQLSDPGGAFSFCVGMHEEVASCVQGQHPSLAAAATRVSDPGGRFFRQSADGGACMFVQTLAGDDAQPLDWAYQTVAATASGFTYTKTAVFLKDASLSPHFELEVEAFGPASPQLLFYANLDARLSLELHPEQLDRYASTAPPGALCAWADLDKRCASAPGWTRFTSPSFHVHAFASQALVFMVPDTLEGRSAMSAAARDALAIWLAWLAADAAEGRHKVSDPQLLQQLRAHSHAWRRFPRREAAAPALKAMFGADTMEDFWDTEAGDPRVRCAPGAGA